MEVREKEKKCLPDNASGYSDLGDEAGKELRRKKTTKKGVLGTVGDMVDV